MHTARLHEIRWIVDFIVSFHHFGANLGKSELRELEKSSKTSWNINFQPKTFLTADENFIKMTCAKYWVRTPNRTRRNKIHNARRHECLGISPVWTHNLEYPWSWRLTDPGFPKISEIHPTLMSSISELKKYFFKISKDPEKSVSRL